MNSRFEYLGNNISVEVTRECTFGEDALLLAQFAEPHPGDRVCDLGTGCGILPLLWCRDHPELKITAVEIQPTAAEMARRSVQRCGLSDTIQIYNADLRFWREIFPPESQNLVTMNPPYFAVRTGEISQSEALRIARHEGVGCNLAEYTDAAHGLLRNGGRFCLCHRPERLCDVLEALRSAGLEPKRLRFIQADAQTAPWLFLCEAKKGGKPGLEIRPPFCQKNADGSLSKEQTILYKLYYDNMNIQK